MLLSGPFVLLRIFGSIDILYKKYSNGIGIEAISNFGISYFLWLRGNNKPVQKIYWLVTCKVFFTSNSSRRRLFLAAKLTLRKDCRHLRNFLIGILVSPKFMCSNRQSWTNIYWLWKEKICIHLDFPKCFWKNYGYVCVFLRPKPNLFKAGMINKPWMQLNCRNDIPCTFLWAQYE